MTAAPLSPAEWAACPFCTHAGSVREFLSREPPRRPAASMPSTAEVVDVGYCGPPARCS